MTKEQKAVVIDNLASQLSEYPHFYVTDIEALNAEQTAKLRRKCFESDIKLIVVKNTLLEKDLARCGHDDVKHGFVISFPERKPDFDIIDLEKRVKAMIAEDLPLTYIDPTHVSIGGQAHFCTGPRIHVSRTGQIENFHLLHHFIYERLANRYLLVGCVGENAEANLEKLDAQQKMQPELIF